MNRDMDQGWAFHWPSGATYHFEHIPRTRAEKQAENRDALYVLETINWTTGSEDLNTCHANKYFAVGLSSAVALAARMEIEWQAIAEDLVAIRLATPEESDLFWRVAEYFESCMPTAISEQNAGAL